jgi:hypothetical protein
VDSLLSASQIHTIHVDITRSSSILYRYQNRLFLLTAATLNRTITPINDWQGQDFKCFNRLLT